MIENGEQYHPDWIPKVGDLVKFKNSTGRMGIVVKNHYGADASITDEVDVYYMNAGKIEFEWAQDLEIISRVYEVKDWR